MNIVSVPHLINHERHHKPAIIWMTGLSGAGKSTIAMGLEKKLFELGYNVYALDGDNLRHGLCSDLGFSKEDRSKNVRRVGEVASLFADAGMVVICSLISPYKADRDFVRSKGHFHEVYIKTSLDACKVRDPKGFYKKE